MKNEEFLRLCKAKVAEYTNSHMDKTDGKQITVQDVYVVWSCKTLQNSKALLSTTVPDGMYYELTYNGDKHELYLDAYKKFQNMLSRADAAKIDAAISPAFFNVTFTDPGSNSRITKRCYSNTPSYPVYSYVDGVKTYKGVGATLIGK